MRAALVLVALLAGPALAFSQATVEQLTVRYEALVRYDVSTGEAFYQWEGTFSWLVTPIPIPGLTPPPPGTPAGTWTSGNVTYQRTYIAFAFKDIRGAPGGRAVFSGTVPAGY